MDNALTHEEVPLEKLIFGAETMDEGAGAQPDSDTLPPGSTREVSPEFVAGPVVSRMAVALAHGLQQVIQEIEKARVSQDQKLVDAIDRYQKKFVVTDRLVAELAARCEQLEGTHTSLQESHVTIQSEIENLEQQTQNLKSSLTSRIDALYARVDAQEKELSSLRAPAAEISPRIDSLVERISRQAEAIRLLSQDNEQRRETFQQLSNVLSRLISLSPPALSNQDL